MNPASYPPRDYEAYGLSVRSPIPLPLFISLPAHRADEPDVTVRIGATPTALPSPIVKQRHREIAPGALLLTVDDVARFLVTNGRDVLVEPRGGSDHDLGVVLGGLLFAVLLQQRGVVTFHASAIETEAGAVLFAGRSGLGKSSLLGAFVRRGYAMLADDVTGVVLDAAGRAVALPAFPSMKLWADALQELAWQGPVREKVRPGLEKRRVPVERFRAVPLAVRTVCVLEIHDRDGIEVRPVQAADSSWWLWESVYRKRPVCGLGQLPAFFRTITAMARRVTVVRVARSAHPFRLDALADRIEEHLRKGEGGRRHGLREPEA